MKTQPAIVTLALLAACGPEGGSSGNPNPPRLYLYLDRMETMVRLIVREPEPF